MFALIYDVHELNALFFIKGDYKRTIKKGSIQDTMAIYLILIETFVQYIRYIKYNILLQYHRS